MNSNKSLNAVIAIVLACTVAACSGGDATEAGADIELAGDRGALPGAGLASLRASTSGGSAAAGAGGLPDIARGGRGSFADLPDRGDLVAYPDERVVRRAGPYTWHRADVSEAHALQAIVGGILTFTAPGGQILKFQYERRVEHDTGDWTWIGRAVGGDAAQEAILTFGQASVFGSISQPGQPPLNLMTEDGASWLVETDMAARAAQSEASGRYGQPDFLLPPEMPRADGMRTQAAMATADATASGTTVDVLIGYTQGFAAAHTSMSGSAGIMTRLHFLVDVTNESYVNSQVDARIRLVHAMQVDYTDANSNSTAVTDLTGSEGSTPDPAQVHPALQPLHRARQQYGADLVSLVRDFQHPEAVNCGVAWLLGGGQNAFGTEYASFGMSVVADGVDGSYLCKDTTLAHELGHNMGLAHDVATASGDDGILDAGDYGRYAYSFGYRTDSTHGNFHTVMAYEDGEQDSFRVFSNPDITCNNFACGIEGQADNALALRQTLGVIAQFMASAVPPEPDGFVRNDLDGDGTSDLVWRHAAGGGNAVWLGANPSTPKVIADVANPDWEIRGVGDFDGDGSGDIVWRNRDSGANALWPGGVASNARALPRVSRTSWQIVGVGDFDGDGLSDLLWRDGATGRNAIWRSGDASTGLQVADVPNLAWNVAGVGDFDADGRSDIAWRNSRSGQNVIWLGGQVGTSLAVMAVPNLAWDIVAVDDFDGDGFADILWRKSTNGDNALWLTGDAASPRPVAAVSNVQWTVAATGDYNGDGAADIFWRNVVSGGNAIWQSADATASVAVAQVPDTRWRVVP